MAENQTEKKEKTLEEIEKIYLDGINDFYDQILKPGLDAGRVANASIPDILRVIRELSEKIEVLEKKFIALGKASQGE